MKIVFPLLIVGVLALPVMAQNGNRWEFADDGRKFAVYSDPNWAGFFWIGDDAYSRQLVSSPGRIVNGCAQPGISRYAYTFSHRHVRQQPVQQVRVNVDSPTFEQDLLALARTNNNAILQERARALQHQTRLELITALGLREQNFRVGFGPGAAYGTMPGSGQTGYGNLQLSSAGAQGTTQYGYSYSNIAQVYGDVPVGALLQQFGRQVEKVSDSGTNLHGQFGQLIGQASGQQGQVVELMAKLQGVERMLRALQTPSATVIQKGTVFGSQPNDPPKANVPPLDSEEAIVKAWQATATQKCASCHSKGAKIEGGFDITAYPGFSVGDKLKVIARILLPEDSPRHMPRGGPMLTEQEIQLWLQN